MNAEGYSNTVHFSERLQQRGIKTDHVDAIALHADKSVNRGGATARWISKKKLREFGAHTPEGASTDQLGKLVFLECGANLITAIKEQRGKHRRGTQRPKRRRRR